MEVVEDNTADPMLLAEPPVLHCKPTLTVLCWPFLLCDGGKDDQL